MILVIDVGNTNIKYAIYKGDEQIAFYKSNTKGNHNFLLEIKRILSMTTESVDECVYISVVPSFDSKIIAALVKLNISYFIINTNINTNLILSETVKSELGNDLLCIASIGYYINKEEMLALSLGTASAMMHIDDKGEVKHCLIFPGLKSGAKNLFESAEQLEEIDFTNDVSFLALNTKNALKSGIVYAYVGSIKYLIDKFKEIFNKNLFVIVAGGMSEFIKRYCEEIDYCDRDLVMKGGLYLYNLNKK